MEGGPPSLWATLVAAWIANLGACWSWGWTHASAVPVWVPPPPLACCAEEVCHCSCDKELRHIIDLQAEVWALRCLLLAGLLLLGFATSTAGLLGFLASVCRRCGCGARGRAPGAGASAAAQEHVEAPLAILMLHENDPHGFFWHHRLLLFRASEDIWICLTPDDDLVRVKLLDTRHEVLERRAPFPAHLTNQVYAHDPIGGAALAAFRRRARLQGQLLGVGQVDAIERMIWVVAEPRSDRFGEVVDAALMDDEGRGTGFDQKGVAVLDGEEFFAQKIAASGLTRSVKEFLDSVASGPGNMTSYQAEWERLSGVGEGAAVNHVRRNLCETEITVERSPRHPDYSGLDVVISAPVNAVGRAPASKVNTWVTDRFKERATIWKQGRLYREEQKQNVALRVEACGGCPTDHAEESSLAEILDSRDHCGMEPKNLDSFDKVKILHRRVQVRPIRRELPPAALGYLRHASGLIERGEAELEKGRAEGQGFSPHWDPAHRRSRDRRKRLHQRLSQQGLLTRRRRLKGRAGIFAAKKNDGPQRLTIDARAGHLDAVELDSMGCRPATVWDDAEGAESRVVGGETLCPCATAACAGWSWALYFANEAVTHRVEKTLVDGPGQIMREMQPAPILKPGKCASGAHVDDAQVIGGCKADAVKQMTEIENACHRFTDETLEVPKRTWPSVKSEIRCAMNLLFLMGADLSAKFRDQVYCGGGPSTRGYALHVDERINLKEARVALMGLRRRRRSARLLGSKLLTLSDSQVTVRAFEKGRSSAGLQALCRRAAACRLGGQIARRLRHVETDRKPSDIDPRQWGREPKAGGRALCSQGAGLLRADCQVANAFLDENPLVQFGQDEIGRDAGGPTRAGRQRPPGKGRPRLPSAPRRVGPFKAPRRDSLAMATVAGATLEKHAAAAHEFKVYARAKRLDLQPLSRLDDSLATGKVDLPMALASLKGWAKRSPGHMRLPLPDIIVGDIALDLAEHDPPLMGAAVSLETGAHARPSEVVELRQGQILPQALAAKLGAHYGIAIAPSEWCEVAKTGGLGDNLLVGDVVRPWLTNAPRVLHQPKAADSQRLFDFMLPEYEREIRKAGCSSLGARPRVCRRSGASNDKARGRRTLKDIQKRGRWTSPASVARREKGALISRQLRKAPQQKQKLAAVSGCNCSCATCEYKAAKQIASASLNACSSACCWSRL
ncbi:unnamed protein product, partial [Prorocentrum cordatum]